MEEINGIKYVTKGDIISAAVKVAKKLSEEDSDPMIGMLAIVVSGELTSELFPKEDKENKED